MMLKKFVPACLLLTLSFPLPSTADGLAKGIIDEVFVVSADNGDLKKGAIRISLEDSDSPEFNSSTCNKLLWLDSKDVPASKELLSLVLTAMSTGRAVQFSYIDPPNWTDACKLGPWIKLR
jgi:hypothetical protein